MSAKRWPPANQFGTSGARCIPWPKVAPPPLPPKECSREQAFRLQNALVNWPLWTMRLIERHYNGVMTDAINNQIVRLARPVARARQPSEQDSNPCLSTGIAFDRAIGLFRSHEARDRPFCPVAPSPCPGTAAAPAAMAADAPAPPDATLLSFRTALAYTGPPIEDGERCHVCNNPAVVEQLHIAWCPLCACTLFTRQQLRVLGPAAKACPSRHALEHAFRWTRIVGRLLAAASRPWSSPTVTLLSLLSSRGI